MRNRLALALLLAGIVPAGAHVTLTQDQADAGSRFVATFRIGHGCSGSPTTAIAIEIPEEVISARPKAKAGWSLAIAHAALAAPRKGEMGESVSQRVTSVSWTGGQIPADAYDEFSVLMKLPDMPGTLSFPATQTCAQGSEHWSGADPAHPVPKLVVAAGGPVHDSMAGMDMSGMGGEAPAAKATIGNAWFRALPPPLPSGGYFTLHNNGTERLTLIGAESTACGMLMLHKSENSGGMSKMEDVASVDLPAGGDLAFAPGGYHLMCMQPTSAMQQGATVKATLLFKGGAKLEADFAVKNASGR